MSIAEVAATLRPAPEDIAQLRAQTALGIAAVSSAYARLTAVTGASHTRLDVRAVARLVAVIDPLREEPSAHEFNQVTNHLRRR